GSSAVLSNIRSRSAFARTSLRSQPTTRTPWRLNASPSDPPINPVPRIVICSMDMSSDRPSDRGRNHPQLTHELVESLRKERLRAIRKRSFRVMMNFDEQCIASRGNGGPGHGCNLVASSGAVGRISSHGQVREFLYDGNRRDVEGVACIGLKRPAPPLEKNQIVVPTRHDVFA